MNTECDTFVRRLLNRLNFISCAKEVITIRVIARLDSITVVAFAVLCRAID